MSHVEIATLDGAVVLALPCKPSGLPCATTMRHLDDPMLRDVRGERPVRLDIDVTALGLVGTVTVTVKEQW